MHGGPSGFPSGIEILLKKASVDEAFRSRVLSNFTDAANEIGLTLNSAEEQILKSVTADQLKAMITHTTVEPSVRQVFLGKAAALMIAALGASSIVQCDTTQQKMSDIKQSVITNINDSSKQQYESEQPVETTDTVTGNKQLSPEDTRKLYIKQKQVELLEKEIRNYNYQYGSKGIRPDRPSQDKMHKKAEMIENLQREIRDLESPE